MDTSIFRGLLLLLLLFAGNIFGQTPASNFWVPGDPVKAIHLDGNTLYAGGSFDGWGPPTGDFTVLDPETGKPDLTWPRVFGTVSHILRDGNGGCYISGDFTHVDGFFRPRLAHINADRSLSDWAPSADNIVGPMYRADSILFIQGQFRKINGIDRDGLAAISLIDGSLTPFNPETDGWIHSIAINDSMLYIGGNFTSIFGQARNNLVEYNLGNNQLTDWIPFPNQSFQNQVNGLRKNENTLYISGNFNSFDGIARTNSAAIDLSNKSVTPWHPDPALKFRIYGTTTDKIYAVRSYSDPSPDYPQQLFSLDKTTGAVISAIGDTLNHIIRSVIVRDEILYVAGYFTKVGSAPRNRFAAFDLANGQLTAWQPNARMEVNSATLINDQIFAGGSFHTIRGVEREGLAALDLSTGRTTEWNPRLEGWNPTVSALTTLDSILYIAGSFTRAAGEARYNLAAFNTNTGELTPWNPNLSGGSVGELLVHQGKIYAAGLFGGIGGHFPRRNFAIIDPLTGEVERTGPNTYHKINAIVAYKDTMYIGGEFTEISLSDRRYLGSFGLNVSAVTLWDPSPNGIVRYLFRHESTLYAAGDFTTIAGQPRRNLAAFDLDTGQLTDWAPNGNNPVWVSAMAEKDGILYIGGTFQQFGGASRSNLVAIDSNGVITEWAPNPSWYVLSIAANDDGVYIGGNFVAVDKKPHAGFASFGREVPGGAIWPTPQDTLTTPPDTTGIPQLPQQFTLNQNYPNPFNNSTTIRFQLDVESVIDLEIFNILGEKVRTFPDIIQDQLFSAGWHEISWDGRDNNGLLLTSGIYFIRLKTDRHAAVKKAVLIR